MNLANVKTSGTHHEGRKDVKKMAKDHEKRKL